jgi:hypothetical protein
MNSASLGKHGFFAAAEELQTAPAASAAAADEVFAVAGFDPLSQPFYHVIGETAGPE